MNFDDSSDQQLDPIPKTAFSSLHNLHSHSALSYETESVKTNQIPHCLIKKYIKNKSKLNFSIQQMRNDGLARRNQPPESKILKKTTHLLQNNKLLTYLSLTLKTYTSFDLLHLFNRLKYLQNISTFNLSITQWGYLTLPKIKILSLIIANLKNLTSFSFQPPDFQIDFKLIDSVFIALKRLASLSRLTLKFNLVRGFGDAHIKKLALHLRKLSKLQSLDITIQNSTEITNTGLQPLSQAFKNLPLLTEVSLKLLSSPSSSTSTFQELFSGLATLKFLKKLELCIRPDPNCYFTEPLSLGLNLLHAPSLREISLKVFPRFTDSAITDISQALARFSSLETLSLDLSNNSTLTDDGIFQLASVIQNLTSLKSLSLISLGHSKLLQAIEIISLDIVSLTQLTNLSLDFSCCLGEKYTTIETLADSLLHLKSLKKLNLCLLGCNFIDDKDLALLAQGLEALTNLTSLTIDLKNIQDITNKGVKSLASSFYNFPKLTHLALRLIFNKTDGKALRIIAHSLQNLPALYLFNLAFLTRDHTSENEGFGALCDTLQNLTSLKQIYLEAKCSEIAREKIRLLRKVKSVTIVWSFL